MPAIICIDIWYVHTDPERGRKQRHSPICMPAIICIDTFVCTHIDTFVCTH